MELLFETLLVDILLVVITATLVIYYFGTITFNHWKGFRIKYVKPVPFLGNMTDIVLGRKFSAFSHQEMYNMFPNEKYYGMFNFTQPTLVIKDPQLTMRLIIKDFSHFYNRSTQADEKLDPLSAHLVFLTDQRWKNVRNKLTPVFTSGKLKTMYSQVEECANEMAQFFHDSIKSKNNLLEMRECMARFTTDVIGSCAFGLQFNALKDPDSQFRKMGRQLFSPPTFRSHFNRMMKLFLTALHPKLPRLLNFRTSSRETEQFYIKFIKDTIKYREENNIVRNDFIQMMMEIRKEDAAGASEFVQNKYANGDVTGPVNREAIFDDKTMASNIFVFFAAGFETTASTIAYCLLELAANPYVQDKMRQEILDTLAEHDGKITYDDLKNLRYVDQVISETLRKYPVATAITRQCSKTYRLPDSDCIIEKGYNVFIPLYAMQHDPQYFPDPDRFDPERFSEDNIKTRPEGTFLPFGDGPRICIGQRFAMMEIKANFCTILPKFEFQMSNKMKYPLEFNKKSMLLTPIDGIWLNVYEREELKT